MGMKERCEDLGDESLYDLDDLVLFPLSRHEGIGGNPEGSWKPQPISLK